MASRPYRLTWDLAGDWHLVRASRPDLLARWTRSAWGSDDYDAWAAQSSLLPAWSPLLPMVRAQVTRLDRELR